MKICKGCNLKGDWQAKCCSSHATSSDKSNSNDSKKNSRYHRKCGNGMKIEHTDITPNNTSHEDMIVHTVNCGTEDCPDPELVKVDDVCNPYFTEACTTVNWLPLAAKGWGISLCKSRHGCEWNCVPLHLLSRYTQTSLTPLAIQLALTLQTPAWLHTIAPISMSMDPSLVPYLASRWPRCIPTSYPHILICGRHPRPSNPWPTKLLESHHCYYKLCHEGHVTPSLHHSWHIWHMQPPFHHLLLLFPWKLPKHTNWWPKSWVPWLIPRHWQICW